MYSDPQYTGPRIENLVDIIVPFSRLLYYLGIFLGVAFMIYAGYLIIMSEGDPVKLKDGQEQLTAAIFGLLFVLLSVVIMRVIINSLLGGTPGF